MNKGFTIIEIMVVAAITVLLSSILVSSFSRTKTDLGLAAVFAGDAVREAQSLAFSGGGRGELRCGYGVAFRPDGYDVYAGPKITDGCMSSPRFSDSGVTIIRSATLGSPALEVRTSVDLFFEPPMPVTYADGETGFGSVGISICRRGATDCRSITVTSSGVISTSK
jgi:prepilin-type N-terminal cleavage/methylation domain-containing protein